MRHPTNDTARASAMRDEDLELLTELVRAEELTDAEREAFADMRSRLESPRPGYDRAQRQLTDKQRAYAEGVARRVGLSLRPKNEDVPAGRQATLAIETMPKPLRPPGRKAPP